MLFGVNHFHILPRKTYMDYSNRSYTKGPGKRLECGVLDFTPQVLVKQIEQRMHAFLASGLVGSIMFYVPQGGQRYTTIKVSNA